MTASFVCFDKHGFFMHGAGGDCQRVRDDSRAPWRVSFEIPHVAFGKVFMALHASAVVDDFGTVVLLADDDGKVVLQ